jgi:hypothetical protein
MAVEIEVLSPSRLRVSLRGLVPADQPTVVLRMEAATRSHEIATYTNEPVGPDGALELEIDAAPPAWSVSDTWEVIVIHSRGVACLAAIMQ